MSIIKLQTSLMLSFTFEIFNEISSPIVKQEMEMPARDKRSSLLQKFANYGRKKFYNIGRRSWFTLPSLRWSFSGSFFRKVRDGWWLREKSGQPKRFCWRLRNSTRKLFPTTWWQSFETFFHRHRSVCSISWSQFNSFMIKQVASNKTRRYKSKTHGWVTLAQSDISANDISAKWQFYRWQKLCLLL